jgi:dienelactone hydrolase
MRAGVWMYLALLAVACTRSSGEDSDDPHKPGLAYATLPAAVNTNGRFEVWCRINDDLGDMTFDSHSMVTIRAVGRGTLRGTLTRQALRGQVVFDDLTYDRWELIKLTVSAAGYADTTTATELPVRPLMRFVKMPPTHMPSNSAAGPFQVELVDGLGHAVMADQPVSLEGAASEAVDGPDRSFATGTAVYDQVVLHAPGAQTLVWRSPGLADLVLAVTVHDGQDTESTWLPAARVGLPYRATLPGPGDDFHLLDGELPHGLVLESTGELHGVPTAAGHSQLPIFADTGVDGSSVLWKVDLSVFPAADGPPAAALDGLDRDGPFGVGSLDDTISVPSRRTAVPARIFFPTPQGPGAVADGVHPLIVFHHGAVLLDPTHPTVYDRYDHFLRRWATWGYVVVTVDAPELVWLNGRLVDATLNDINAMSEDQRACIAYFKGRVADPTFVLAGHVDVDRIIAAGHSRGGGASIITARAEPSVVAGILIKPLDPMQSVGGEQVWDVPLPSKPFLLIIAGNDGDLPYPMVDYLYERRSGPVVAPTILGSLHSWSCDASCPPDPMIPVGIPREQDWSVTNAYAVAFLAYAARGDLTYAPLLFDHDGLSTHLSKLGTLTRSDRAAAPLIVDDFQRGTPGRNSLGLPCKDQAMVLSADEPSLITALPSLPVGYEFARLLYERPADLAQSNAHRLQWSQDGASYATSLGDLDARGRAAFVLRARTDQGTFDPAGLSVRVRDAAGKEALVGGIGHTGDNGIGPRFSDLIVPTAELAGSGLDLEHLDSVELVFRGAGTLLIDDLRFE